MKVKIFLWSFFFNRLFYLFEFISQFMRRAKANEKVVKKPELDEITNDEHWISKTSVSGLKNKWY